VDEQGKLADMVSCVANVGCDVCVIADRGAREGDKMWGGIESKSQLENRL
jgi:hypothetical protein